MSVIALPEASARSTIEPGPGFDIGWLVPPLPAKAVESRHLMLMRAGQEAVQRPATMNEVGAVLTAWRAAERELNVIGEGSPDCPRVNAEIASLRAAYHRHFEERWQLAASY